MHPETLTPPDPPIEQQPAAEKRRASVAAVISKSWQSDEPVKAGHFGPLAYAAFQRADGTYSLYVLAGEELVKRGHKLRRSHRLHSLDELEQTLWFCYFSTFQHERPLEALQSALRRQMSAKARALHNRRRMESLDVRTEHTGGRSLSWIA